MRRDDESGIGGTVGDDGGSAVRGDSQLDPDGGPSTCSVHDSDWTASTVILGETTNRSGVAWKEEVRLEMVDDLLLLEMTTS